MFALVYGLFLAHIVTHPLFTGLWRQQEGTGVLEVGFIKKGKFRVRRGNDWNTREGEEPGDQLREDKHQGSWEESLDGVGSFLGIPGSSHNLCREAIMGLLLRAFKKYLQK